MGLRGECKTPRTPPHSLRFNTDLHPFPCRATRDEVAMKSRAATRTRTERHGSGRAQTGAPETGSTGRRRTSLLPHGPVEQRNAHRHLTAGTPVRSRSGLRNNPGLPDPPTPCKRARGAGHRGGPTDGPAHTATATFEPARLITAATPGEAPQGDVLGGDRRSFGEHPRYCGFESRQVHKRVSAGASIAR